MQKPKGMSRKDAINLKRIVRQFLNDPFASVDLVHEKLASGFHFHSTNHDEGYSATSVEVHLGDKPGTYEVGVYTNGRDCDGRRSSDSHYVVGPTGKRKRWYWNRNWQNNRPTGKFEMKGSFKVLSRGKSSQRDYTAEASGY